MRRRRSMGRSYRAPRVNLKAVASAARRGAASALRGPRSSKKKQKNMMLIGLVAVVVLFWGKIKAMFVKS